MAEKLLFVFLFLIPTQLGRHFWPEWSTVMGIRSDYLSPILYLTDIVWGLWVLWKIEKNSYLSDLSNLWRGRRIFITGLVIVVGLNIWLAGNPWVAGYKWMRIIQWLVTVWMMRNINERASHDSPVQKFLRIVIPIWIIGEGLLAMAQVAKNGSLQGIFWWLGERKFDYMTIGTALMTWGDEVRVRAYGTFSHPNSLAGFLLVGWMVWEKVGASNLCGLSNLSQKLIKWVVRMMALVGIVLAGSRTVWLVAGLVVGYEILRKIGSSLGSLRSLSCLIIVVIGGVFLVGNSGGWDKESYGKRMELNKAGWEMIKSNPLLGVGAGNFVVELPEYQKNGILWLQPVHNIFLLGLAEIGILGVMVILWAAKSLGLLKRLMLRESWWIVGVVVLTGIVDHYWLTLPQNSWLCAIVMAII